MAHVRRAKVNLHAVIRVKARDHAVSAAKAHHAAHVQNTVLAAKVHDAMNAEAIAVTVHHKNVAVAMATSCHATSTR